MIRVLSDEKWKEVTGLSLPKTKKASTSFSTKKWETTYHYPVIKLPNESVLKQAVFASEKEGYLRAVLCVAILDDQTLHACLFESTENPLSQKEIAGAVILEDQDLGYFKEEAATHTIRSLDAYQQMNTWFESFDPCSKIILNIHHDYVRVFRDVLLDLTPLIRQILEKDTKSERM